MTTYFRDDADVARVGVGLLDRSLPKTDWTHAGHFAAAVWFLRCHPERSAATDMPGIIRAYNEATGVENTDADGYHETITQASLRAARSLMDRHPPDRPLHEIVDLLLVSPLGSPDWLLAYWSRDRLFSVAARRSWIEPDLQLLPW